MPQRLPKPPPNFRLKDLDFEAKERPGLQKFLKHEKWTERGSLVINRAPAIFVEFKFARKTTWISNDLDFSTKTHVGPGSFQVLFWQRLQQVGDRKKSKVNHPTCKKPKKPKKINRKTYQSIILGVLPCFTQSMQMLFAKIDPFQVTCVVSNLFKPTKTDTILYGWPLPSKVDSEFGADSEAPTIGFSRPIQIVLRVTFRWCKLMNPSVRNGFEISTYLAYVIFISRDIWGSHSLIEVVPSSSFRNTNRCSRVHAPAAPCRGLTYRRNRTECVVWVNGTFVHFRAFAATPKKKSSVFFPTKLGLEN